MGAGAGAVLGALGSSCVPRGCWPNLWAHWVPFPCMSASGARLKGRKGKPTTLLDSAAGLLEGRCSAPVPPHKKGSWCSDVMISSPAFHAVCPPECCQNSRIQSFPGDVWEPSRHVALSAASIPLCAAWLELRPIPCPTPPGCAKP